MPNNKYKGFTPEEKKAAQRVLFLKRRPHKPITPYTDEERKAAHKVAQRKWYENNRERAAHIAKRWKAANPDKVNAQYLRRLPKQLTANERFRLRMRGLTLEDYNAMVDAQGGVCAICFRQSPIKLAIDHCHKTGRVRGLLCGSCNRGIGLLQDDSNILISAAKYLHDAAAAHPAEML